MLTETLLDQSPLWLLFALTVVWLFAGNELGYRLGDRRRRDDEKAPAATIMGSTLGLLAFILAFTFGMSSTRFDARRQLVLDEASAILRTYQRAQFLPEEQRTESSELLREYVSVRNRVAGEQDLARLGEAIAESNRIQSAMWSAVEPLAASPNAILSAFLTSLTDLSDIQMKRVRAAVWNRIPPTILVALYSIAFLAMMAMGYGTGLTAGRAFVPTLMLVLTFSSVIILINDLERPVQTLFSVNQEPMLDVESRIEADRMSSS